MLFHWTSCCTLSPCSATMLTTHTVDCWLSCAAMVMCPPRPPTLPPPTQSSTHQNACLCSSSASPPHILPHAYPLPATQEEGAAVAGADKPILGAGKQWHHTHPGSLQARHQVWSSRDRTHHQGNSWDCTHCPRTGLLTRASGPVSHASGCRSHPFFFMPHDSCLEPCTS